MNKNKLKNKLGMTLTQFAKTHDFNKNTVIRVLGIWAGKRGCPRGTTKQIIDRFEEIIGEDFYIKD